MKFPVWSMDIRHKLESVFIWLALISAFVTIGSFVAKTIARFNLGRLAPIVTFLGAYYLQFWLGTITFGLFLLGLWAWALRRRFTEGFRDDFDGSLGANWDCVGDWKTTNEGYLVITNSHPGGLTKIGAYWENYTVQFEACILNGCLGVVVRALDLGNYYMFQIRSDRIRPHRLVAVPILPSEPQVAAGDDRQTIHPVTFVAGWAIPEELEAPLIPQLSGWFSVELTVRGESAAIKIDGRHVFHAESYLRNPTGKVGFRQSGSEKALVRRLRVILHP